MANKNLYKSTISTKIANMLSPLNDINERYQLTEGTETDFNNAALFLFYTQTKNSDAILAAETPFSEKFGNILQKYYKSYVSDEDISSLCNYIKKYNDAIIEEYFTIDDNSNLEKYYKILSTVYGINPETMTITKNSYADNVYAKIKEEYKTLKGDNYSIGYNDEYFLKLVVCDFIMEQLKSKNRIVIDKTKNISLVTSKTIISSLKTSIEQYYYEIYLTETAGIHENEKIKIGNFNDQYKSYNTQNQNDINIKIIDANGDIVTINNSAYVNIINNESENNIYVITNSKNLFSDNIKSVTVTFNGQNDVLFSQDDITYLSIKNEYEEYSATYQNLITNINSELSFENQQNLMKKIMLINYEFAESSYVVGETTFNKLKTLEKRSANSVETYYAYNYYNLNYLSLQNILIYKKDQAGYTYSYLKNLCTAKYNPNGSEDTSYLDKYGFNTSYKNNEEEYVRVTLNIVYKELNPEIRQIDFSSLKDNIIGSYLLNKENNDESIINSSLYDSYSNIKPTTYDETSLNIFKDLHTNPYIIRNSVVDDIVAYLAGENTTNFGVTTEELNDIEEIKTIYKEVRDFFYKVLMDHAYVTENMYGIYKEFFMKAVTIERFMSSRLDNLTTVDKFTKSDCKNFLLSYGLKLLSDQIDKENFTKSINYEKRIIANYNNLMSKKGSRSVIDELLKIFDYDTTNIEICKYLLLKINEELKFVKIPYSIENISTALDTYSNNSESYLGFINNDKYWSDIDIPEETASELVTSPINTKYIGLQINNDIYSEFIKTKYIMSAINYLYDMLEYTNGDSTIKYLKNLTISPDILNNKEINIADLFNLLRLLFAEYVYVNENITSTTNEHVLSTKSYYGINRNTTIGQTSTDTEFSFYDDTFLTKDMLCKLFQTPYIQYSSTNGEKYQFATNCIDYFIKTGNIVPFEIANTDDVTDISYNKIIFGTDTLTTESYGKYLPKIIPLSKQTLQNIKELEISTSTYNNFVNNLKEYLIVTAGQPNDATETIVEAFKSISIINFINKKHDTDEYNDELKSIYFFNKMSDMPNYPISVEELGSMETDISWIKTDFYTIFLQQMLEFPIDYTNGKFGNHEEINYFYDVRKILDELFDKYYTTQADDIGYFTDNESANIEFINKIMSFCYSGNEWKSNIDINIVETLFCNFFKLKTDDAETTITPIDTFATTENLELISKNLISLIDVINESLQVFNNISIEYQFTDNKENLFDFIQTCVEFFMSYTTTLYSSFLQNNIDTKNERIPITYKIKDIVSNDLSEYLYYDEKIEIEEKSEE